MKRLLTILFILFSYSVMAQDSLITNRGKIVIGGSGTVTNVSSADANATVANQTTTPVITIVSAPKLQTARNIQGVPFDGTTAINPINGTGFVKASGTTLSYDNSAYLQNITGLITAGTNINITGSGTSGSPYVINSVGGDSIKFNVRYPLITPNDSTIAIDTGRTVSQIVTGGSLNKVRDSVLAIVNTKQNQLSGTGYAKWSGTTPSYLTPTQVTADLNVFTSTLNGMVPFSGGSAGKILHADGVWRDTTASGGGGSGIDSIKITSNSYQDSVWGRKSGVFVLQYVKNRLNTPVQLTDGATITWNASLSLNDSVTLGGNRTLAITNAVAGMYGTIVIIQDGSPPRTLAVPANSLFANGGLGGTGLFPLTSASGAKDVFTFYYDGTFFYWKYNKNFKQ